MLYAFINDGVVKKIEDSSEEAAFSQLQHFQQVIPIDGLSPLPEVGWTWDGISIFKARPDLTPRQLRLALLTYGVDLTMITTAINSMPEPSRSYASISWDYAISFERRSPMISGVAAILGLTSEEIDYIWDIGANL